MHIFGELPQGNKRIEFINAVLEFDYRDNKNLKRDIKKVLNNEDIADKKLKEKITDLNKRIDDSKEIKSLLNGFDAKYIEPGPSGLITRGRDDILPTGRNFYSLDPYKVPTKASYRIGVLLAEKLIEKYLNENNRYPENVAMYWMCSDIMWADGEPLHRAGQQSALRHSHDRRHHPGHQP